MEKPRFAVGRALPFPCRWTPLYGVGCRVVVFSQRTNSSVFRQWPSRHRRPRFLRNLNCRLYLVVVSGNEAAPKAVVLRQAGSGPHNPHCLVRSPGFTQRRQVAKGSYCLAHSRALRAHFHASEKSLKAFLFRARFLASLEMTRTGGRLSLRCQASVGLQHSGTEFSLI